MEDKPDYVVIFLFLVLGVAAIMLLGHIVDASMASYHVTPIYAERLF